MRPFLKWAGGKYRIVNEIVSVLPSGARLIEPFVGSGALFLNSEYASYLLSDTNADLICLYQQLQKEGEDFIRYCKKFFVLTNNTPEKYYELRESFNSTPNKRRKAALFLYLNRHGFNGLCRYNASGKFNVPFGRYRRPYFPQVEMEYFCVKAKYAEFRVADFEETMGSAVQGDVIYCDPPYVPLSDTANFTNYSSGGFGLAEQKRLASMADKTSRRGIPVVISNHAMDLTKQIYARAALIQFLSVQRNISCDGNNRTRVRELLAVYEAKEQSDDPGQTS